MTPEEHCDRVVECLRALGGAAHEEAFRGVYGFMAPRVGSGLRGWAHFLAQMAHESAGFRRRYESLNYNAAGLHRVFPRHYTREALARRHGRTQTQPADQEAIANLVYADENRSPRHRLGNTEPGDGWRYRGRGWKQLTGRANYRRIGGRLNLPLEEEPDMAARPGEAFMIAAEFWDHGRADGEPLKNFAQREMPLPQQIRGVTIAINGGTNGLDDRTERTRLAFDVLKITS